MKRFKNLLVVYNDEVGADDALTQAAALARANGARLTLIDFCPEGYGSSAVPVEREKRLERAKRSLKLDGLCEVNSQVLIGTAIEKIIYQVVQANHDMVIATSTGGGMVRDVLYGSLATQLMRKCPCPVWIVKPGQAMAYSRILAAVHPDPSNPADDPLCVKVMDMATSLANAHGAELHVLHAWEVDGNDRVTIGSEVPDKTYRMLLEKHEGQRRDSVKALLERYRDLPKSPLVHLPRGLPQWEIVNAVKAHDIDLVVMGTAGRSGLLGLLVGNTAESIMAAVGSGILTVKPEGLEATIDRDGTMAVA
jgi:universal stress protein E